MDACSTCGQGDVGGKEALISGEVCIQKFGLVTSSGCESFRTQIQDSLY